MKKIVAIITVIILIVFGVNYFKDVKMLKKEEKEVTELKYHNTIVPLDNKDDTKVEYRIENFKEGKYKIRFYAKEYKEGSFVREHSLFNIIPKFTENEGFVDISIIQDEAGLSILYNDSKYSKTDFKFFNNIGDKKIVVSKIEKSKDFFLDKGLPIAIYSISDKEDNLNKMDIDNYTDITFSEKDLVLFFKITEIK